MISKKDPELLEARRIQGVELYKKGWSEYDIAEALGVTQPSLSRWVTAERERGREGLKSSKYPGPKPKLDDAEKRELKNRLEVHRPPAYAPELNADEYLWNWIKNRKLVNRVFNTLDDLAAGLRRTIRVVRRSPDLIQSFYKATPLSKPNKKKIAKLCAG